VKIKIQLMLASIYQLDDALYNFNTLFFEKTLFREFSNNASTYNKNKTNTNTFFL